MFRKLLLGLGLASALGAGFVQTASAFGCDVCRQLLREPRSDEFNGTLQYAFLCDTSLNPQTSLLQFHTETGWLNLRFGTKEEENQAAKLVGKKVKVTGRRVISGLQVTKIEAA